MEDLSLILSGSAAQVVNRKNFKAEKLKNKGSSEVNSSNLRSKTAGEIDKKNDRRKEEKNPLVKFPNINNREIIKQKKVRANSISSSSLSNSLSASSAPISSNSDTTTDSSIPQLPSILNRKIEKKTIPQKNLNQNQNMKNSKASMEELLYPYHLKPLVELSPVKYRQINSQFNRLRYLVTRGNNSRILINSLNSRSWWHPLRNSKQTSENSSSKSKKGGGGEVEEEPNLIWEMYRSKPRYNLGLNQNTILNHLENNPGLSSKKGLFFSLLSLFNKEKKLDKLYEVVPKTFYLSPKDKINDRDQLKELNQFCDTHSKYNKEDIVLIVKPASHTNRGYGIKVIKGFTNLLEYTHRDLSDLPSVNSSREEEDGEEEDGEEEKVEEFDEEDMKKKILTSKNSSTNSSSNLPHKATQYTGFIIQEYLEAPLLYRQRKFDIRAFVLITCFPLTKQSKEDTNSSRKNHLMAYFYSDAYLRTSSKKYSLSNINDKEIHLTNDAIQNQSENYGQLEQANKVSLLQWANSLEKDNKELLKRQRNSFHDQEENEEVSEGNTDTKKQEDEIREGEGKDFIFNKIMPYLRDSAAISVHSMSEKLLNTCVPFSFELFGYDFILTEEGRPLLLEINSNPCLDRPCPLLEALIPNVIEDSLKLSIDLVVPKKHFSGTKKEDRVNRFVPIYNSLIPVDLPCPSV